MQEVILFYNGLGIPTRQILDSRGAIPTKTVADAKVAIKEMAEYSHKWHNGTSRSRSTKFSDGLAAIQAQLNNLGREIKKVNEKVYDAQVGWEQCKGPHYTKDFPLKEEGKTLEEAYYTQFGGPFQGGGYRAAAPGFYQRNNANPSLIILDMPEDIKVPLILGRPFLSTAYAKIDVYKRKITLRVGEERIIFTSVKPTSSLVKRVYMLSLREKIELDLEARLMGETLVINRSLDPVNGDYIELNDINEPFELRRNQGDDLMPTIEEGEVIEEFRTRDDELDIGIDDYPSYCDYGALMNMPIFVGTFSVVTDFAVLEDMDAYRDEGMGDVIFG
ncbi:hypothetical protein Tco_1065488 [Tanacetum coccineum]